MWNLNEIKQNARANLKKNYWAIIAVCFLMTFLMSEYSLAGTLFTYAGDAVNNEASYQNGYIIGENISPSNIISYYTEKFTSIDVKDDTSITGTKGVLAAIINGTVQGANVIKYGFSAFNNFLGTHKILEGFISIILILLNLAYFIFVKNLFIVGERRFFLENKCYHDTQIRRILYIYSREHMRHIWNPAKIMLQKTILNILWAFTIVGGVYKFYEYRMIRYILAENPDIDSKTCFSLSKQMMNGCKWRMFLFDCSFIPWYILTVPTLGVLGWFYVNPYYTASESEIYLNLRSRAIAGQFNGYEMLNDDYLVNEPEERALDIYPTLVIHERPDHLKEWKKHYSLLNMTMLFFTFMFAGWIWEVFYTFMLHGSLVNRGSLHGPWLPIYGIGGVMIIVLFRKLGNRPHMMFALAFVCCGILEYFTAWYFDKVEGVKYWDYSGYFLNLNGYICLEGLLMFAFLACAGFYIIAPRLDDIFNKIPVSVRRTILAVLTPLFCIDVIYSHFYPNTGKDIGGADYEQ